jgi:Calcineurin-like phosphoesterase
MTSGPHRVAFFADIFYNSPLSPAYWLPPEHLDVEAVLLGGDIHYLPDQLGIMLKSIRASQMDDTYVIVVPGNGEYIDQELNESRQQYWAEVESVPNAIFLDNDVAILPSGLRVIGSTLWSHVDDDNIGMYNKMLADHGLLGVDNIRLGDRYLTLRDTNELHDQARAFVETELRRLSQAERDKTIVCTHFWPTLRPWRPPGDQGPSDAEAFDQPIETEWYEMTGSNLDALVAECGPKLWLCGHAHTTHQVTIGNTEISSNPRAGDGPGHVNPEFKEFYLLEL